MTKAMSNEKKKNHASHYSTTTREGMAIGDSLHFVIYGNPRTKKNSGRIAYNKRTGKPFVLPSKAYEDYTADALRQIVYGGEPISCRVNCKYLYYMQTKRLCDRLNLQEATDDILVERGVLADDNYSIVAGHDGSRVYVDKDNPRVEITITAIGEED